MCGEWMPAAPLLLLPLGRRRARGAAAQHGAQQLVQAVNEGEAGGCVAAHKAADPVVASLVHAGQTAEEGQACGWACGGRGGWWAVCLHACTHGREAGT